MTGACCWPLAHEPEDSPNHMSLKRAGVRLRDAIDKAHDRWSRDGRAPRAPCTIGACGDLLGTRHWQPTLFRGPGQQLTYTGLASTRGGWT